MILGINLILCRQGPALEAVIWEAMMDNESHCVCGWIGPGLRETGWEVRLNQGGNH